MSGEAFTKAPQDTPNGAQPDFDLEGWISGARLPEKSVTVYGRADLVADLHELELQLTAARTGGESADERLAGGPSPTKIAARIEGTRAEMESSALTFRFRALLETERVKAEDHKGMSEDDLAYTNLATQCVHPKVTAQQWPRIRSRIGEGQFAALLEAAASASYDRRVSVPFSLAASATLSNEDS